MNRRRITRGIVYARTGTPDNHRYHKEEHILRVHTKMLIVLLSVAFMTVTRVSASTGENSRCIQCHSNRAIIVTGGGHLYIDPDKFAGTTHEIIGCISCHDKVSKRHPADRIRPSRANCKECHAPVHDEYAQSLHGNNARCADCHNPHAVKPLLAVSGRDINIQCTKCHDGAKTLTSHSKWLPQAALHIDALPCITCHTGSKNYVISLYIEKQEENRPHNDFEPASYEELAKFLPAGENISELVDTNKDNFISLNELKKFHRNARYKGMRLWGMMTPEVATHSYQILNNRWDCTFCHASGPNAMQTSYIAFPGKNGKYNRVLVEKGAILDILYGTPDFYMLGSTRSTTLNIIGAIIIAGGLLVPIVHGTFRILTIKKRKGH